MLIYVFLEMLYILSNSILLFICLNYVYFQIGGLVRTYTFTKMQLHDGSLYDIKIISCNGANLCEKSILANLLVDTSPPVSGNEHILSH